EVAAEVLGEAPPQLRRVPLPDGVGAVVVAVPAQWLPDEPVGLGIVAAVAQQRATVGADRAVTAWPTRRLLPAPTFAGGAVHGAERRRGEGEEDRGMVGHRLGHAQPAGQPGHEDVPGVALVLPRARRTHRGTPVTAAHVGVPVRLISRGVRPDDLT